MSDICIVSFKGFAHFSQLLNVLILLMLVIMEDSDVWLSCSCVVPLAWRLCRALIWPVREWNSWKSSRVQFSKYPIYFQSVINEEIRSQENKACLQHFSVIFLTMMDSAWSGNMILCLEPALGTFYVLLLFYANSLLSRQAMCSMTGPEAVSFLQLMIQAITFIAVCKTLEPYSCA